MSKPNIRFIYRSQEKQQVKSVKSIHKGPINLDNLYDTYANPSYHQIDIDAHSNEKNYQQQPNQQNFKQQTSVMEVISKPTSPKYSQIKAKNRQNGEELLFTGQLKTTKNGRGQSPRPILKIQQINESELLKKSESKVESAKVVQAQVPDGQIVLKSPSFKFVPKQEGEVNSRSRKQYVRAEKAQKYLYNGIPQKSEDDFIGCFGCFQKKPKTYKVTNQ